MGTWLWLQPDDQVGLMSSGDLQVMHLLHLFLQKERKIYPQLILEQKNLYFFYKQYPCDAWIYFQHFSSHSVAYSYQTLGL